MTTRHTITKARLPLLVAGTAWPLSILAFVFGVWLLPLATAAEKRENIMEEEIWKLEATYFANLYGANYEGVLALVHSRFLGWPDNLPSPINKEGSAQFMKNLIPEPEPCTIRIERAGLQILGHTALTQYILHVNRPQASGTATTRSSRITHTWIMQDGQWKLLGGMSLEIK